MAEELNVPIFKKTYELYKLFYHFRKLVPKQDKYTIWQKAEGLILEMLEYIIMATYKQKLEKIALLEKTSVRLNLLRVLIRLMRETGTLNLERYTNIQEYIDEIGRMLGGWIRSISSK